MVTIGKTKYYFFGQFQLFSQLSLWV